MALSSLAVTLNALRLARAAPPPHDADVAGAIPAEVAR